MKNNEELTVGSKFTTTKIIDDKLIVNKQKNVFNLQISDLINLNYEIERFLPNEINDDILIKLVNSTNNGFGISLEFKDIENHILKSDEIFILKINGNIIGFSSQVNFKEFIYRYGTVIEKEFQGIGLYKILNNFIHQNNKKYFLRTQNLNIIKSLEKSFDNVLYGKNALNYINTFLEKGEINDLMILLGDSYSSLDYNGIFKGIYRGKMGSSDRINYIDETIIEGFNNNIGDSLLVVYFNN